MYATKKVIRKEVTHKISILIVKSVLSNVKSVLSNVKSVLSNVKSMLNGVVV